MADIIGLVGRRHREERLFQRERADVQYIQEDALEKI
jgi:hypothetical protein